MKLEAAIAPAVGRDSLPPVPNVEYKSRALYVTARLLEVRQDRELLCL